MLRNFWFQFHWLLGITAGVILALVGFTGGMLSFQDEILHAINPGIVSVTPRGAELSPAELMERVRTANPGKRIQSFTISGDPAESARVMFAPERKPEQNAANEATRAPNPDTQNSGAPNPQAAPRPGGPRGEVRYVDPYTGELLPPARGREFFQTVEQLHRRLLLSEPGKQIVGAATLCLLALALSGLYLRWPRHAGDWRAWLTFSTKKKGRGFLWGLHSTAGTWALLFYLLTGFTGAAMSYDWLRNGLYDLAGVPRPQFPGGPGNAGAGMNRLAAAAENGGNAPREAGEERRRQRENTADESHGDRDHDRQGKRPFARNGDGATVRGEARNRDAGGVQPGRPAFDAAAAWAVFQRSVPAYSTATLRLPERPGQPAQFTYLDPVPQHERAFNRLSVDAAGAVLQHERYADKPLAAKLLGSLFPLHSGSFFGLPAVILIMAASLTMPLFAVTGWMLYLDRRRNQRAARAEAKAAAAEPAQGAPAEEFLIGYASQTGHAERLAWQTAAALQAAGLSAAVHPLSQVNGEMLGRYRHALFIVSTFGDGQPPDNGRGFLHRVMPRSLPLPGLRFGLAIFGDRQYDTFCGFGRALDLWLRKQGAQPLFDTIEIDDGDAAALRRWGEQIVTLGADEAALQTQPYGQWRLAERRCLNPGSQGDPVFHLELEPVDPPQAKWVSGDLAEILMRHAVQNGRAPTRQFSIASLPQDGRVHLLVRQARLPGGALGLGSGWLTEQAALGGRIEMRIDPHRGFRLPEDDRPLILVGNGTGIAGLRSHLKARVRAGRRRNWLVFGERNAAHDFHYREDIEAWQAQGFLERIDLAFSRDQAGRVYVQQRLREAADALRAWVDDGAAIYVCGSLEGMAPAVDEALADVLGAAKLDRLAAEGRYRRDVY